MGLIDMNKTSKIVEIFTDGGCVPNPGVGGWGAILRYGDNERELSGGEPDTTNNRMELTACIVALESLKRPCDVVITTDSKYVQNGITQWIHNWKLNGWRQKKRSRGAIKNIDLWKRLDDATIPHNVKWEWIKGHSGHVENERCDRLAESAINAQHNILKY